MRSFSRTLARWNLRLVAAITLAAAWLFILAAFAYSAATTTPPASTIAAAAVLLGIAGTGFMYAWREPGA